MYEVGGALPTKVVCLTHVISPDDLKDDEEYGDILDDMTMEARKYGKHHMTLVMNSLHTSVFTYVICLFAQLLNGFPSVCFVSVCLFCSAT